VVKNAFGAISRLSEWRRKRYRYIAHCSERIMSKDYWPELYTGPWIVTGNVAKLKVVGSCVATVRAVTF
jgi:hypothetical protein